MVVLSIPLSMVLVILIFCILVLALLPWPVSKLQSPSFVWRVSFEAYSKDDLTGGKIV